MSDYTIDFSRYLEYNTLSPTGLVWKTRELSDFKNMGAFRSFHSRCAGEPAGGLWQVRDGYIAWKLKLNDKPYMNSRIIYSMMVGAIPEDYQIDHIDLNPLNNRISNLRLATRSQNLANAKAQKNNALGFKGVSRSKNRFRAIIGSTHLGTFKTPEEASNAYCYSAEYKYGEFARI